MNVLYQYQLPLEIVHETLRLRPGLTRMRMGSEIAFLPSPSDCAQIIS